MCLVVDRAIIQGGFVIYFFFLKLKKVIFGGRGEVDIFI